MKIYGINNCDSVKHVRKQLDKDAYTFIDFKTSPPTTTDITRWFAVLGDKLVNRQSRTWREHKEALEAAEHAGEKAFFAALAAHPQALKRPIVETEQNIAVGKNALQEL